MLAEQMANFSATVVPAALCQAGFNLKMSSDVARVIIGEYPKHKDARFASRTDLFGLLCQAHRCICLLCTAYLVGSEGRYAERFKQERLRILATDKAAPT